MPTIPCQYTNIPPSAKTTIVFANLYWNSRPFKASSISISLSFILHTWRTWRRTFGTSPQAIWRLAAKGPMVRVAGNTSPPRPNGPLVAMSRPGASVFSKGLALLFLPTQKRHCCGRVPGFKEKPIHFGGSPDLLS